MKSIVCGILIVLGAAACPAADTLYAVRGVWLTNVDSKVLNSRRGIEDAVTHCAEIGINTIFAVTWNKGMTTYPSAVMKRLTGVEIDTQFTGRDPLRELIEAAHARGIRVVAWFEFGFSSSYQAGGGPLLQLKPAWASRTHTGGLVSKNGFEWMNGFHPEVQEFMLSLVMEVVERYDIDGIQGDDRLPAMPSESGYEPYTVERYRAEHGGAAPPENTKDPAWVQWRADILSAFLQRLYRTVKQCRPSVLVTMAPSIYPWSKEEYLQDWPAWINGGYVDLIIPQIYRYDIGRYSAEQDSILTGQIDAGKRSRYYPGILLNTGEYCANEDLLAAMISDNRKHGIPGEVFFFYEGLKRFPAFFRTLYPQHAEFPNYLR